MSKKKRRNRKARRKPEQKSYKRYAIVAVIALAWVGYWALVNLSEGGLRNYPKFVEGVFYATPTVSEDGTSVSIQNSFVEENKLVYVDVRLEEPLEELVYLGRTIPLGWYRDGEYLPLVVISTPKGETITGIRVCEPCGSFDFHIIDKKYLDCDACHTRWNIETMNGLSGGCLDYPPPELSSTVGDLVEIYVPMSETKLMA
jgi:hypothetical protein